MNDYVDLHTHTIASGHAYSTIEAMIKARPIMTEYGMKKEAV